MSASTPSSTPSPSSESKAPTGGEEGRYAGYAGRMGQLVRAAQRLSSIRKLAYTSDLGEAARPIVPKFIVNASYAVSVGYVIADVVVQTHKEHDSGASLEATQRVAVKTSIFQLIASIGIPFVAIHSQVSLFQKLLADVKIAPIARHGPSVAGLALIPFLPLVDHPIEHAVDHVFDTMWPMSASVSVVPVSKKHD